MVGEDVVANLTELVSVFPPDVAERVLGLITILKAVGILAIAYIIYLIVTGFVSFRQRKRLKIIEEKVLSIDKKLNRLLKKRK